MHLEQSLTFALSTTIPVIASAYFFSKSQKTAKHQNYINEKKAYAEQFNPYITILYKEYDSVKENLRKLSDLLCDTNTAIGETLDIFDNRNRNNSLNHTWFLRHLYHNLYSTVIETIGEELKWQSSQYLYSHLSIFKTLDAELDFKEKLLSSRKTKSKNNGVLGLFDLLRTPLFRKQFIELTCSINENSYLELYNQIISQCQPLINYLSEIKLPIEHSLNELEINYNKNKLEAFKLREDPRLHDNFCQLMKLLTFINQSRLGSFTNLKSQAPYNTLSQILYIGILMECKNKFINHIICSFELYV